MEISVEYNTLKIPFNDAHSKFIHSSKETSSFPFQQKSFVEQSFKPKANFSKFAKFLNIS